MSRKGREFIKDKGLVKFILQHWVKEEIDLSKVAISSFADVLKDDEEGSRAFRSKYLKLKSEERNSEKVQAFPIFRLSLFDVIKMEENFIPPVQLSFSLFQWINLLNVIHIICQSYYIYYIYIIHKY